jgi:hypothetical protein
MDQSTHFGSQDVVCARVSCLVVRSPSPHVQDVKATHVFPLWCCVCLPLLSLSLSPLTFFAKTTERTKELILFPSQILPPNSRINLCILHLEGFPFSYGALASMEYLGRSKKAALHGSMTALLRCMHARAPYRSAVAAHARPGRTVRVCPPGHGGRSSRRRRSPSLLAKGRRLELAHLDSSLSSLRGCGAQLQHTGSGS